MLGAIFKLSYNEGVGNAVGGICGSCFFINPNHIVTANHILNKGNFKPNDGYKHCQYWVLSKDIIYEVFPEYFKEFPETDLTLIKNLGNKGVTSYKTSKRYSVGTECYNEGFMGSDMPILDIVWKENKLIINKCHNIEDLKKRSEGEILSIKNIELNASDIKIKDKKIIECNYGGHEGMSGGPLIKKDTREVIGMMSFGLPPNNKIKDKLFAISIEDIQVVEGSLK